MEVLAPLLSGFGLSASAGLNAYIPLLIVSLGAYLFPDMIKVTPSLSFMTEPWFIILVAVLLVVEVLADKVPAIDHLNDLLGTIIRPAAGAVLFASMTGTITQLDPKLAAFAGLLVAGTTHGAKATARPIVTATTGGLGNPVVSTVEDVAALVTSVVSIVAPLLIGLAAILLLMMVVVWRQGRSGSSASVSS